MANDNDVKFKLDLDAKDFVATANDALGTIKKIGSADNLSGLIEGLTEVGLALGSVALVAYAFKEAINLTVEGEQIKRTTEQFEMLSAAAGISASTLKSGLEEASKGLVDTNELLKDANKFIVEMGSSAAKLPEIMELARKSTLVFGGDLKTNFDNIATAISTGNTRMLKHLGIVVDAQKAVNDYAKANGLAANEISEAGKRQAILNEALALGKKQFANVNGDLNSAESTLQTLKATVTELKDAFVVAFEKTIGPAVRSALVTIKDFAVATKNLVKSTFGDVAEQNEAKLEILKNQLKDYQAELDRIQKAKKGTFGGLISDEEVAESQKNIDVTKAQITALEAEKAQIHEKDKSREDERLAASNNSLQQDNVNHQAKLENEVKFRQQLRQIREQYLKEEANNIDSLAQLEIVLNAQKESEEAAHQDRMNAIKSAAYLEPAQKQAELDMEDQRYHEQQLHRERDLAEERAKLLDNYVLNSKSALDGIGRAFQANALKEQAALGEFGKMGQKTFQSFKSNATSAFQEMGAAMVKGKDIASAAGDAIKKIMLNVIADQAIAQGEMLLLSGIWPPNPLALGAGAGLIALGGALKAIAGGSGGGSDIPSGGGGSGGGDVAAPAPIDSNNLDSQTQQREQRHVNVNIAGNYFDTDSSRRQLMEIVRSETDATDFTYNKIGP